MCEKAWKLLDHVKETSGRVAVDFEFKGSSAHNFAKCRAANYNSVFNILSPLLKESLIFTETFNWGFHTLSTANPAKGATARRIKLSVA